MSKIEVTFACGHSGHIGINSESAPICPCGERQIVRTKARAPKFTGAVSGPYAETKPVEAGIVNVAPAGALKLKEPKE